MKSRAIGGAAGGIAGIVGIAAVAAVAAVTAAAPPITPPRRGAVLPFTTLEAENPAQASTGGAARVVRMTGLPGAAEMRPELEASGRGFVELARTGDSVTFRVGRAADAFVLRHCIPDAPGGGGQAATLSLLVNGKFCQSLALSSKHNWLYGMPGQNGQSEDPSTGAPHVFWDETRFRIAGSGLSSGDRLTLQKGEKDSAAFYRIDLADIESVPAPLKPPKDEPFLSIADFGANGSDTGDDTAAFLACIAAAKAQKKTVWVPPGTYYQSGRFVLDGVSVRGAGVWHTALVGSVPETGFAGSLGFTLGGDGASVRDLFLESVVHTRRPMPGGKGFVAAPNCRNWRVENVWISHAHVGFWMSGAENGVIRGCRVRNTYADAINLNRGSRNNLVENCHIRGAGDDGIALLSEKERTPRPSADNIVRGNTVEACWWGHNLDIAGGGGHIVENNYLADNALMGCLTINLPAAFPMYPVTGATIRGNTIARGGGGFAGQRRGAVWFYAGDTDARNVVFENNDILAPIFRGIHVTGGGTQEIVFRNNRISDPGEDAIYIDAKATGRGMFTGNTIRGLKPGFVPLANRAGERYLTTLSGNSWP